MAFLQNVMMQLMDLIYAYTNSYGIAIILITIFIKVALMPLTFMQLNSMKKMQEMAPMQKKLQEKYKNDKEKLNTELMKLYQDNKVNPMGGCLPLLIQFPFIIALFRLLQNFNFGEAGFLWIQNLGAPDKTFILPILAALTTFLQSKLSAPANPENPTGSMNIMMALFIGWMSVKFAAGLALYWVVSNLVQIAQSLFIMRPPAPSKEDVR